MQWSLSARSFQKDSPSKAPAKTVTNYIYNIFRLGRLPGQAWAGSLWQKIIIPQKLIARRFIKQFKGEFCPGLRVNYGNILINYVNNFILKIFQRNQVVFLDQHFGIVN